MARKHTLKRNRVSQPVVRELVSRAVVERRVVLNPKTGDFEVQHVEVKPAVWKQGKALGTTIDRTAKRRRK